MGDNIYLGDRDGVRTPMQWSPDRNAGFSRANSQRLYLPPIIDAEYHFQSVNVETQRLNPESLLWWTKRLIALRQRHPVFGRGSLEFLAPDNPKVLAYLRSDDREDVLVVANLSRFAQCASIDLSRFDGRTPTEMFGRTPFPPISKAPYFITLSPHAFYWFAVERQSVGGNGAAAVPASELALLRVEGEWTDVFRGRSKSRLENVLRDTIRLRRWFGGKANIIQALQIFDAIEMEYAEGAAASVIAVLRVDYVFGEPETYIWPLAYTQGDAATDLQAKFPAAVVCRLQLAGQEQPGVLYDALWQSEFTAGLLDVMRRRRRFRGNAGEVVAHRGKTLRNLVNGLDTPLAANVLRGEQSNSSIAYADRLIFKLFRHVEAGMNPDLELGKFLTDEVKLDHIAPVAGWLEYRAGHDEPFLLGMLTGFVPNQGTAWQYAAEVLARYFEQAAVEPMQITSAD
ncbi:MAG: alpha-glucosidase C-terminal domain-containing protein, partial [Pirellulales bacterium]